MGSSVTTGCDEFSGRSCDKLVVIGSKEDVLNHVEGPVVIDSEEDVLSHVEGPVVKGTEELTVAVSNEDTSSVSEIVEFSGSGDEVANASVQNVSDGLDKLGIEGSGSIGGRG